MKLATLLFTLAITTLSLSAQTPTPNQLEKIDWSNRIKGASPGEPPAGHEIQITPAVAAAEPAAKEWWTDFSISPFAGFQSPNLTDSPRYAAGLDIGYNINRTVSLHVAALTYDLEEAECGGKPAGYDQAIDETSLIFRADLIRDSKERFVGYLLGSGDRSWEDGGDWGFGVGAGAELRFSKNVSAGVDSRIRAWFDREKDLFTRALINVRF